MLKSHPVTFGHRHSDLYASETDIRQYAGRSCLNAIDAIELHFMRSACWEVCHVNDARFTASIRCGEVTLCQR